MGRIFKALLCVPSEWDVTVWDMTYLESLKDPAELSDFGVTHINRLGDILNLHPKVTVTSLGVCSLLLGQNQLLNLLGRLATLLLFLAPLVFGLGETKTYKDNT